jgi:hypothetical protein
MANSWLQQSGQLAALLQLEQLALARKSESIACKARCIAKFLSG